MDNNTEAQVDSTQQDDSQADVGRTEDQLLADIVRNSDFISNDEESLPEEQVPELDPEQSEEVKTQESEEAVSEEVEEEVQPEGGEIPVEDAAQAATQSEIYTQDDLDLNGKGNSSDLDSDGDGCFDVIEAGFEDPDQDGILGTSPVQVDDLGRVTSALGYTKPADLDNSGQYDYLELPVSPNIILQPLKKVRVISDQNTGFI